MVVSSKHDLLKKHLCEEYGATYVVRDRANHWRSYNLGVEFSKGKLVAFIDDDARADPYWIEEIYTTYLASQKAGNKIGAVGGRIIPDILPKIHDDFLSTLTIPKIFKNFFNLFYFDLMYGGAKGNILTFCESGNVISNWWLDTDKVLRVDWLTGCNMVILKKIFESGIWLDENLKGYGEPDFFLQVKKKGFDVIYNPRAKVYHDYGQRCSNSGTISNYICDIVYFFIKNRKNINGNRPKFLVRLSLLLYYFAFLCHKENNGILKTSRKLHSLIGLIIQLRNQAKIKSVYLKT